MLLTLLHKQKYDWRKQEYLILSALPYLYVVSPELFLEEQQLLEESVASDLPDFETTHFFSAFLSLMNVHEEIFIYRPNPHEELLYLAKWYLWWERCLNTCSIPPSPKLFIYL